MFGVARPATAPAPGETVGAVRTAETKLFAKIPRADAATGLVARFAGMVAGTVLVL